METESISVTSVELENTKDIFSELGKTKKIELNSVEYTESYLTIGRNPYFPILKGGKRAVYCEVVKCLVSLGYEIQVDEKGYKDLKNPRQIPAICSKKHGIVKVSLSNLKIGISCCRKCGDENRKTTNIRNIGVENQFQSVTVKEQIKQTNIENRGVAYSSQDPLVKEKIKQTNLLVRGVTNPSYDPKVIEKIKQTNLERTGYTSAAMHPVVKEKMRLTNQERRGYNSPSEDPVVKEKKRLINLERRKVENPFQDETVKEKIRQTHLLVRGVTHPSYDPKVIEKSKQTNLDRIGVTNPMKDPEIREKARQTNLERRDVEFPMQSEEVRQKAIENSLVNWGTRYPMQNAEVRARQQKSAFGTKPYLFPSGKEIRIQGYEHYCLNDLLFKEGVKEEDINSDGDEYEKDKMPEIWYEFEDAIHRYFPDFYLPKQNLIIEVKSTYTYQKDEEKNLAKAKACREQGYLFEFRIYSEKGELLERK